MKTVYEKVINQFDYPLIKRTDANENVSWIPTDPANSDYQAYLEHLTENPTA